MANANNKFSVTARAKSLRHAGEGILSFFKKEHNAYIHMAGTILVLVGIFILPVSRIEMILLVIVTGMVWMAELFNTAIERIMDSITMERHPAIKIIKDISAAAVLVSALTAFLTGCIVFIPKL